MYALDVTDPFNFSASDILWEYNFNDARDNTDNSNQMGHIKGAPQIARLNNGQWGVIFGNGYNSDSHEARLFILNAENGEEIAVVNTRRGSITNPNGLATPLIVDENNDRIADTVYAGDLLGNLYKFTINNSNPNNWGSVFNGSSLAGPPPAEPLFQAKDSSGATQPITTRPTIIRNPAGGFNIIFGTGKYLETSDQSVSPSEQIQTLYSIWDDDMDSASSRVTGLTALQEQTIEAEVIPKDNDGNVVMARGDDVRARIVSQTAINYGAANPKKGWYLNLDVATANGERVIADPITRFGRAIFTTFIPTTICEAGSGVSVLMELDALSGARLEDAVFDLNGDGVIDSGDLVTDSSNNKVPPSGVYIPGTLGSPSVISLADPGTEAKQFSTTGGEVQTLLETGGLGRVGRQSWRQLQ